VTGPANEAWPRGGRSRWACKRRYRHQEFLAFLEHIDASVPAQLDVHLVIDNYAAHKLAAVRAWLAARPRYHVHFTL
jgi:putative transposase